jgi:transglutaminase-like putative cysteine protease
MMWLTVDHTTRYTYDRPVRSVVQSHRLMPSAFDGQRMIDWNVTVSGGVQGSTFRDGAGDRLQAWTIQGPVSEITVHVQGTVETIDLNGILRGHRETVPPAAYLRMTDPTRADAALSALAAQADGPDALARAHALSALVSDHIAYSPGTTTAQTTAAEALTQGKGVCQDQAHALIAMARCTGLPARYVSGYLHASADGMLHEAAHAWAEIWANGLGWVGFDPANRCCPDARYIRLGSGMDAQDAAPIRGVARGAAQESMDVSVAVLAAQQ